MAIKKWVKASPVRIAVICVGILLLLGCALTLMGSNDAKTVYQIPDGFAPLKELEAAGYQCVFWENQVSVMNGQDCYFQTNVKDKDFIVKYQGQYYLDVRKIVIAEQGDITSG